MAYASPVLDRIRSALGMKSRAEQVADEDVGWLMSTKQGRRAIWRLLSESGVFRNPYSGKREDTDFRCGEMNVGQRLLARVLRVAPHEYVQMTAEAASEEELNKNAS